MIKVENFVECYEVEGKDVSLFRSPKLIVRSHWNRNEMVVIETPDGTKYTVLIKDLNAAISNSGNSARF